MIIKPWAASAYLFLFGFATSSLADNSIYSIDHERLVRAEMEAENWLTHGRTYDEQRFSPLADISDETIGDLGLAWHYDLETRRGMEATPIVVDGIMYVTGSWARVYALKADTGQLLWEYDPEFPREWSGNTCCDAVNRGVAVWKGKVFVGTLDGRLVALDAQSGEVLWDVMTIDTTKPYSITGAPRVIKGKVIIGNSGAEFGVRGYVSAYDSATGAMLWRFFTVPGNPDDGFENNSMAMAAETWHGEWWKFGGGGTVWDSMAYDPDADLLYIGVGNGSPWNRQIRSPGGGDNLFLSSIVALRPDTGEYVWHYQTTPGETWDYTATQHMILADLEIDGVLRKVLMQAPKNGFFYVIDRITGELISAQNYVKTTWASHIDMVTGRPVEVPGARYENGPVEIFPSSLGGHSWHPMSYSPVTGFVYIPAQELSFIYKGLETMDVVRPGLNIGVDLTAGSMPTDPVLKKRALEGVSGHISAWDPVNQKEVWRVKHQGPWNGGMLSTEGNLLFQGNASGQFVAYNATTGKELWSFDAQTGVVAAPVTYKIDGHQYVSVSAGWGGGFPLLAGEASFKSGKTQNISRILTFRLGGEDTLSNASAIEMPPLDPPVWKGSDDAIQSGNLIYHRFCLPCHGDGAVSGGLTPDLRYSSLIADPEGWQQVLQGYYLEGGMPSFKEALSTEEMESIRAYVVKRAWDLKSDEK